MGAYYSSESAPSTPMKHSRSEFEFEADVPSSAEGSRPASKRGRGTLRARDVIDDAVGGLSDDFDAADDDDDEEEEEEDDDEEEEAVDEVAVSRARLDALAEEIEGVDAALGARVVEELLTQVLCRIDAVDVHGDADLRAYRKRLIRRAEARSSGG